MLANLQVLLLLYRLGAGFVCVLGEGFPSLQALTKCGVKVEEEDLDADVDVCGVAVMMRYLLDVQYRGRSAQWLVVIKGPSAGPCGRNFNRDPRHNPNPSFKAFPILLLS
jgi:hypothetical protein